MAFDLALEFQLPKRQQTNADLNRTADIVIFVRALVEGHRKVVLDLDLSVVDVGRAHLEFGAYILRP